MKIELSKFHASRYNCFSGDEERWFAASQIRLGALGQQMAKEVLSISGHPVKAGGETGAPSILQDCPGPGSSEA